MLVWNEDWNFIFNPDVKQQIALVDTSKYDIWMFTTINVYPLHSSQNNCQCVTTVRLYYLTWSKWNDSVLQIDWKRGYVCVELKNHKVSHQKTTEDRFFLNTFIVIMHTYILSPPVIRQRKYIEWRDCRHYSSFVLGKQLISYDTTNQL